MAKIRIQEVEHIIQRNTHPFKTPGYDLITGKVLKELPRTGIRTMTQIFNSIFRLEYFPCHWKIGQIMIPKPRKNPTEVSSYRPISLPLLSKNLEKLILKKIDTYSSSKQYYPFTPIWIPAKAWNYTPGPQTNTQYS